MIRRDFLRRILYSGTALAAARAAGKVIAPHVTAATEQQTQHAFPTLTATPFSLQDVTDPRSRPPPHARTKLSITFSPSIQTACCTISASPPTCRPPPSRSTIASLPPTAGAVITSAIFFPPAPRCTPPPVTAGQNESQRHRRATRNLPGAARRPRLSFRLP